MMKQHPAVKHIGFANAAKHMMATQGVSKEQAGAMLAVGARNASAEAKERNPHLARVKGGK